MGKIRTTIKLNEELWKRVKIFCIDKDVKLEDFIEMSFVQSLEKEGDTEIRYLVEEDSF